VEDGEDAGDIRGRAYLGNHAVTHMRWLVGLSVGMFLAPRLRTVCMHVGSNMDMQLLYEGKGNCE
jgi:hypothetical protein